MLCLRTHAPIVEDDQDIGEPDGSVTINIGRAIIGCWLTIVTGSAFGPSSTNLCALAITNGGAATGEAAGTCDSVGYVSPPSNFRPLWYLSPFNICIEKIRTI